MRKEMFGSSLRKAQMVTEGRVPCLGELGITLEGQRANSQSISVIFVSKRR